MIDIKGQLVTIGPVTSVAYLERAHCNAKAWKEVCLISLSGRQFWFNKLLLASMSDMFRVVMMGHFSSPHYSHGDRVCITTEFRDLELEHLYQLCHYGQLTLTTQDAKPCLKSLGVEIEKFDMTAQVFDGTVIKMEVPSEKVEAQNEDEEEFKYSATPQAFLDFTVKQPSDDDTYMDYEDDSQNFSEMLLPEFPNECPGKMPRRIEDLDRKSVSSLRKLAESHEITFKPKCARQKLLSLLSEHFLKVHNMSDGKAVADNQDGLPLMDSSESSCNAELLTDIKNCSISFIRNHAAVHGIVNFEDKNRKDISDMLFGHYQRVHNATLLLRKPDVRKKPCFQLDVARKSQPKNQKNNFLKKQVPSDAPRHWSEEVKASIFYFPTLEEMPRDLSLSWQCGKCSRGFQTVEGYRQHWWRHTVDGDPNRAFVCVRCMNFETSTKRGLAKHKSQDCGLQRHVDTESIFTYYCALCEREGEPFSGTTFKTSSAYQRHLSADHLESSNGGPGQGGGNVPVIDCSSCGRQFPVGLKTYLRSHINKSGPHHNGRCWACPMQFATWKAMQDHLNEDHGGEFKWLCGFCGINAFPSEDKMKDHRSFCRVFPATQPVREVEGEGVVCTVCGDVVHNTMIAVKQHLLDYHGEAALKCHECGDPFFNEHGLTEHINTQHRVKRFPCTLCDKTYSKRAALKTHMDVHGEPKFACQFCTKKFHRKEVLYTHEKMKHDPKFKEAEDAKKKVCDICGWEGAKRNYLQHVKYNHLKEEVTCDMCGKKFEGKMHLQKHINKDHNFKQCTLCGMEVKNVYFRRHMLVKHADDSSMPHQCSVCHKGFYSKQQYVSHMSIHTGEKPHSCRFCERKFGDYPNCMKHMREAHSQQWQAYKESKRKPLAKPM